VPSRLVVIEEAAAFDAAGTTSALRRVLAAASRAGQSVDAVVCHQRIELCPAARAAED